MGWSGSANNTQTKPPASNAKGTAAPVKNEPNSFAKEEKKQPVKEKKTYKRSVTVSKVYSKDFENIKTALFVKTMRHDLVLINDYNDTLEERIARLLTNHMGETLRTEVVYALIQEFKKFMYLAALEILESKYNKDFEPDMFYEDKKTKIKYYVTSYHPPHILDLVWKFIIQEGEIYHDFCEEICGGYIDRSNPLQDMKSTLTRYSSARIRLEEHSDLLKPYWGLWPKLDNINQIGVDYEYDSFLHLNEKIAQLINFREFIKEEGIDDFDVDNIKKVIDEWRDKNRVTFDEFEQHDLNSKPRLSKFNINKKDKLDKLYAKLCDYELHENFRKSVTKMFMLDDTTGRQLIREYKNFLFMYYLTDKKCAPSFEIDEFWDLHYASTKDYRDFWNEVFGEYLPSKNYDYTEAGMKLRAKDYKISLELYEELFSSEPNEIFWESPVDLVINSKNGFQHVSLYNYAWLCIYHRVNATFEFKNTLRRNKEGYYDKFDEDELETINKVSFTTFLSSNTQTIHNL